MAEVTKAKAKLFIAAPRNLIVYCSDYRTRKAVNEFIDTLTVDGVDQIVLPGGAWWVASLSELSKKTFFLIVGANKFSRIILKFLIKHHKLVNVFLLCHQDCSWYKNLYPALSQKEIIALQEIDLRNCREVLTEISSRITVRSFECEFDHAGNISFREVY